MLPQVDHQFFYITFHSTSVAKRALVAVLTRLADVTACLDRSLVEALGGGSRRPFNVSDCGASTKENPHG